jgi:SNF2 family DNA or RNA helicase
MSLLDYQEKGVEWMVSRENSKISGGILCDEMGLGKTIQVIFTILKNPKKNTLVIVPKSIVEQWVSELNTFAPSLSVCAYNGTHRKFDDTADVCVCPYSVAVDLTEYKWSRIILDEGHEIRNQSSLIHKTCMKFIAKTKWVVTGTPVFNNLRDFVSLCKFVGITQKRVQAFFETIKDEYVLRRMKSDVKNIIPYDFENVELDMTENEREVYSLAYSDLEDGSTDILEGILRCRQVCAWPQLYYDGIHKKFGEPRKRWKGMTAKVKWLLKSIKSHQDEKTLVFTQFKGESEAIKIRIEYFLKRQVFILDGQTENREDVIQEFRDSKNGSVFIIQIKTGGVGLNLQEATRVYIMQPAWNPATELQAIARSHRGNQTKKVYVKKLVYVGPDVIETELVDLQNAKSKLCSQVLGDESHMIPKTNVVSNFVIRLGKTLYDTE